MLLSGKVAVIYGAGGAVGSAVARTFHAEGATVCATGRARESLASLADSTERIDELDAFNEAAVTQQLASVVDQFGRVYVSFNLISVDHVQGTPLIDLSVEDFCTGIDARARTHFITSRAAARHMVAQGSGTILMLTSTPDRADIGGAGSFGPQCATIESLARSLAVELGPSGIRTACIRSAGSPEAAGVDAAHTRHAAREELSREAYGRELAGRAVLGRMPTLDEVAGTAAFLASDSANAMTGAIVNVTCGQLLD